jgi:hypothetical protein
MSQIMDSITTTGAFYITSKGAKISPFDLSRAKILPVLTQELRVLNWHTEAFEIEQTGIIPSGFPKEVGSNAAMLLSDCNRTEHETRAGNRCVFVRLLIAAYRKATK